MLLSAAALIATVGKPAFAGINRWTSNGPYGGNVSVLAVDPSQNRIAYAGIQGYGVFKTVDGGASWNAANLGFPGSETAGLPLYVLSLTIDPQHPSTLYAGLLQGGVFKSTDGGATWHSSGFESVFGLAIDPRNPSTVYASTGGGVSKSLNGGVTWDAGSSQGLPDLVGSLAMDSAHPDVLYVLGRGSFADSTYAIYRSGDGGQTWAGVPSPSAGSEVRTVSVDLASRVFATTEQGLFRSGDAGATWTKVLPGVIGQVAAAGPSELYVAGSPSADVLFPSQVFRSTDGGERWQQLASLPTVPPSIFASSTASPATIYGGASYGVVKTSDSGATWISASTGLRALNAASPAMDPRNPGLVYSGSSSGLFRSDDGAGSWSLVNPDAQLYSVAIQPGSLDLYAALGRSTDGGTTWQAIEYPVYGPGRLVIALGAPSTFFIGNYGVPNYLAQVFKSTDSGGSWTASLDPQLGGDITSLAVSASGVDVYATISGFAIRSFERSTDGGASWFGIDTSGWPSDWYLNDFSVIAVDPTDTRFVYASLRGRLYRSAIGGGQWVDISAGLPEPPYDGSLVASGLAIDPSSPTTIYAATPHGVFRSPDRGATWTSFRDGLPDGPAGGLVIDSRGRVLQVGSGGGVYDLQIAAPCVATASSLCLLDGRFVATVQAVDPRTGRQEGGTAVTQSGRYGYFSLPGFTGDPSFPEIVVKMADATSFGQGFWVFHSGLTDLQYTLSIVDTVTGRQKSYQNDRSDPQSLCGGSDTETFTNEPVAGAQSSEPSTAKVLPGEGSPALDLLGRFQATLSAVDPRTGRTASGIAVAQDAKWGYFSLPAFTNDATFPEVFVKMLDATALPGGYFWLFHTGLTDLEYTLTVTDQVTGEQKTYRNDRSDPSRLCGGADTQAFQQ